MNQRHLRIVGTAAADSRWCSPLQSTACCFGVDAMRGEVGDFGRPASEDMADPRWNPKRFKWQYIVSTAKAIPNTEGEKTMKTTIRRSRLASLGLVLALAGVLSVLPAVTPEVQAACDYPEAAFTIDSGWGKEWTPNVSTCDSDQYYRGKVYDTRTDGSCVWVQFREGSTVYTQAVSCNSYGINYSFWDQNGNGWSTIRICRNTGCYPTAAWGYYTDFY